MDTSEPKEPTLLGMPAELRNMIWRFSIPNAADLDFDVCIPSTEPLCREHFIQEHPFFRYDFLEESLLWVTHQIHNEVKPYIVKRKSVPKFCTGDCVHYFLKYCAPGSLDGFQVHLQTELSAPLRTRMELSLAKMTAVRLFSRRMTDCAELKSTTVIDELTTAQELHFWARFAITWPVQRSQEAGQPEPGGSRGGLGHGGSGGRPGPRGSGGRSGA